MQTRAGIGAGIRRRFVVGAGSISLILAPTNECDSRDNGVRSVRSSYDGYLHMDSERYQRLRSLFMAAADLSGESLTQLLERECPGDAELRREAKRLIRNTRAMTTGGFRLGMGEDDSPGLGILPRTLGSYVVEREIGRGGMGIVYEAIDTRLERRVALKQLPNALMSGAGRDAFRREAKLLAAIQHPHIATIYSLEEIDDLLFITLELISGGDLRQRMCGASPSMSEILGWAHQLTLALEAAHGEGVVHLDLKPANIMVTGSGQLKVVDFGIARPLRDHALSDDHTPIVGTPGCMSPEQLLRGPVDERADLWALGCILYEWFSGDTPFGQDTAAGIIERTLEASPDWDALFDHTPAAIRRLIRECLERNPEKRPRFASEVRRVIDDQIALSLSDAMPASELVGRTKLPLRRSGFIGRGAVLEEIRSKLADQRMVTLTGVGGAGKTRIALEIALELQASSPGAVEWLELAALRTDEDVTEGVAHALGVTGAKDRHEAIVNHLANRTTLLVLDNCEHVLAPIGALVADVLRDCPGVTVLTTSREGLGIGAEECVAIAPFEFPLADERVGVETLERYPSVQLFLSRSESLGFRMTPENAPHVASVCRRLDGIALAIELAASRLQFLRIEEIDERLENRFQLLTRGGRDRLPHHQALRATIEWSYQLLDEPAKVLFRRLSVFGNGWTLEAAELVCAGEGLERWEVLDVLSDLIGKSLAVVTFSESGTRYRFLETVRAFAVDRFDEEEPHSAGSLSNLVAYALALCEEGALHLTGRDQGAWFDRLDAEHENIHRALEHCLAEGEIETAARVAVSISTVWELRGRWRYGIAMLEAILQTGDTVSAVVRARVMVSIGTMAVKLGQYDYASELYDQSIEEYRRHHEPASLARVLTNYGVLCMTRGDNAAAREYFEEAVVLFRETEGGEAGIRAIINLSNLEGEAGRYEVALPLLEEATAIATKAGDPGRISQCHANMGFLLREKGDYEEAGRHFAINREMARERGDPLSVARATGNLGIVAMDQGDYNGARPLLLESLEERTRLGDQLGQRSTLVNLALVDTRRGEYVESAKWLGQLLSSLRESPEKRILAYAFESAAGLAAVTGDPEIGAMLYGAADALREAIGNPISGGDREEFDQEVDKVREALGDDRFHQADQRGRNLALEEASDLAASVGR